MESMPVDEGREMKDRMGIEQRGERRHREGDREDGRIKRTGRWTVGMSS